MDIMQYRPKKNGRTNYAIKKNSIMYFKEPNRKSIENRFPKFLTLCQ